jgi:4'-phosphopantetheinyl transferase EntD
MSNSRIVSAERVIHAPASKIFDILANPYRHHEIDGSGTVVEPKAGTPERLFLGAKFSMDMKMKASYPTTNHVVEFEENHVIAWHHIAQFVWRYQLDEVADGTLVRESFDYRKPWGLLILPLGWPAKNKISMEQTLSRLAAIVETA